MLAGFGEGRRHHLDFESFHKFFHDFLLVEVAFVSILSKAHAGQPESRENVYILLNI